MWSLLDRKTQVTIIITLSILALVTIQTVIRWFSGSEQSAFHSTGSIVFVVGTVCLVIFNTTWRWLWKTFPILGRVIFPDLNGTWDTVIQSNWKDPSTGQSPGPIQSTVWVHQNLLSITVRQQTKESPSWSTRMFPYASSEADRYGLWYSYDNKPHANVAGSSPDHEGVCRFEMNLQVDQNKMHGQYYTSRSTSGNMHLNRVSTNFINLPGRAEWAGGQKVNDFRNSSR